MKSLLLLLTICVSLSSFGQKNGQRKSPHDTVSNANVSITYGRPYKHNRDVFGGLEKFGVVWRLGADEATTITFNKDVKFGTTEVKAGTYTLSALLNQDEWTLILNSVLGQWGAFSYEKNKDKDVAKFTVKVKKLASVVEQLTISFDAKSTIIIKWDKTEVDVPLKF